MQAGNVGAVSLTNNSCTKDTHHHLVFELLKLGLVTSDANDAGAYGMNINGGLLAKYRLAKTKGLK
jgi:hypothetical protein